MKITKAIVATLTIFLLSGCGADRRTLVVGGKHSVQDEIAAEMLATLAEDAGIPVARRIGFESTRLTLATIQRGDIDIYPEYTGSGLAMLGLSPMSDSDPALQLLRERFDPLALGWSDLLGFENDYGLAMLRDRAQSLDIQTYSDLGNRSDQLVIGVEDEFRTRPVDGLQPLRRRYGMRFERIVDVPLAQRVELYEKLTEGQTDVSLVHTTDAQLEELELVLLEDDLDFFAKYAAAFIYRDAALERFPALEQVLGQLAGSLDNEAMRRLTDRVALGGESPAEVARSELIRLGLLSGEPAATERPKLDLAISPSANAGGEAAAVIRALRRSYPLRNIRLTPSSDPLAAVKDGTARLALVSAPAFFAAGSIDPAIGQPPLRSGVEAVALAGSSYLHAFALDPKLERLADADRIATGPQGSSSHRAAQSIVVALGLSAQLTPVGAEDAQGLANALADSGADAAMLMQPIGNATALELLERGLPLLPVTGWNQASNRLIFPYFQPAQLTANDYAPYLSGDQFANDELPQLRTPVETLVTQLVLAGPGPTPYARIGNQGPGAGFAPEAPPLTDLSVKRINAALDQTEQINPILPQAAALAPELPQPPDPVNPSPAVSAFNALVLAMLVWMLWLVVRPDRLKRPSER